ncbi:ubiquitin-conjugating enzyme [Schizothecium vesticola]|uniref:E2 ubiquitin-conjugating enzyme n=1 Tax=Schizothecium vesticola TaxID=314040 RepID=A0AA40EQK2_9PEZI|nr:ubiquitin-conjugating enzyme [Schizothecium vesticola]
MSKRIAKELSDCTTSPPPGISITLPSDSDLHKWHVTLTPSPTSIYAGGTFGLVVTLPPDFPFRAPHIVFSTRIYHPNVTNDAAGNICLGLLKDENWKPGSRLRGVLEAVRGLLDEPNPDDPLEPRIADEFRREREVFDKNARAHVVSYAKGKPSFVVAAPAPAASGKEGKGGKA